MNSFLTIMLFCCAGAGVSMFKIDSEQPAPQPTESTSVEYDGWDGCDPSRGICYWDET